jgi:predicted ATP-dependent endonuclease of OLD family
MNIDCVDIQNFRKLKKCRIDFSKEETVLVGANNSGKTTAMDALILFLKKAKFSTRDFTLTNWLELNMIGSLWINQTEFNKLDFTIEKWTNNLPSLDIWLDVELNEIHHVSHLIPTLDWDGGFLGVRLRFEPNDIEELYKEFILAHNNSKSIAGNIEDGFKLWPDDLWDFLDKKSNLNRLFSIKTYLLNPELKTSTQELPVDSVPIDIDVISGLIKVDIINAQRGFSDVNTDGNETTNGKNLSSQLRGYYDKHLNPSESPTEHDVKALNAIQQAKKLFEDNLQESFRYSLNELEKLNYPGFGNPTINLSSKFNTVDSLNHDSSVQYNLCEENPNLTLPEKYNGLGYQNLISMIFKLIRFRDEWMQVGKNYNADNKISEKEFEPLHLVLIEEPEAHLHAQVQQVFIKEAYKVLRNHVDLKGGNFKTQLLISTHSNHIAHEIDFTSLRYFKRIQAKKGLVSTSEVVNLSETFGTTDDSTKFAIRYLKATHSDLFFADAVILVEGPVERMLIPHFIKKNHKNLTSCYISILEIGGSHAHTLQPLIENLGIITLIITDLDSVDSSKNNAKTLPEKSKGYKTGNDTLKKWFPLKVELDDLLKLSSLEKEHTKHPIKVAYQIPLQVNNGKKDIEVYPYTFEDSLVMENRLIFEKISKGTGLLAKMVSASKIDDIEKSAKEMYDVITEKGAKKAEFALELLYFQEPNDLTTPEYIKQGLDWLETKLVSKKDGLNISVK